MLRHTKNQLNVKESPHIESVMICITGLLDAHDAIQGPLTHIDQCRMARFILGPDFFSGKLSLFSVSRLPTSRSASIDLILSRR